VAADLGVAEATVYRWRVQDLVERGIRSSSPAWPDLPVLFGGPSVNISTYF